MVEWLRPLIFRALNRSSRVTCETGQVLFAGGQVVFLGALPCLPYLPNDSAQNE